MSTQDNKAIARRFAQVWGNGNLDIIDELAAPTLMVKYPALPQALHGKDSFKKMLAGFRSAFPDSNMEIEEAIAEGDKVVVSWTFSGTHKGAFMGIPPTGKKVRWTGISIYRITGGKVAEEKGEEDFLSALRQLGGIPQPKA